MALIIAVLTSVTGCSSFRGAPAWDPAQTLESTDRLYADYLKRFYSPDSTDENKAAIRNEYIAMRLGQVDRAYGEYKQDLYTQRVSSAVGVDVATMGLAGAAAAVSDVGTKTGASALAAVLTGTKASVDKNVYFDRTLPAMLAQMDGLRSVVRARLFAGTLLPVDSYSMAQADSDLGDYRHAGTIYGAISAITTQAVQAQAAAEKVLQDRLPTEPEIQALLRSKGFIVAQASKSDAAGKFEACVADDGTLDPKVAKPLNGWLSTVGTAWVRAQKPGALPSTGARISDFLSHPAYEPLRQLALADPAIGPLVAACK